MDQMIITVEELKEKMDAGEDIELLDVREPYEYEEFNIGAKLVPLNNLPLNMSYYLENKDKEIVVICRSGQRSAMAQDFMIKSGCSNVKNLVGGMLDWQKKFS